MFSSFQMQLKSRGPPNSEVRVILFVSNGFKKDTSRLGLSMRSRSNHQTFPSSYFWKALISERVKIGGSLDCRARYSALWRAGSNINTLGVTGAIRDRGHKDQLVEVIWSPMPTKFSRMLWRIKWGCFNAFMILKEWGVQIPAACLLYNSHD